MKIGQLEFLYVNFFLRIKLVLQSKDLFMLFYTINRPKISVFLEENQYWVYFPMIFFIFLNKLRLYTTFKIGFVCELSNNLPILEIAQFFVFLSQFFKNH